MCFSFLSPIYISLPKLPKSSLAIPPPFPFNSLHSSLQFLPLPLPHPLPFLILFILTSIFFFYSTLSSPTLFPIFFIFPLSIPHPSPHYSLLF
ncbi:unnamed protein product [Meloidogyne enterolobii]|uniref:Uncharacterized protein n=1 Tax=Meloidogyne enterolobii TaxID=390850 RepID=A0ACB0ZTU4_MELEN